MAKVQTIDPAAWLRKWADIEDPGGAQVGWMAYGVRSRRYDPHVYMCRACGTWNLVLFPHGRADWHHGVQVPPGASQTPPSGWVGSTREDRQPNMSHQIITRRVRRTDGAQLAIYIHTNGTRQSVSAPLPTTVTSATMWPGPDRRSWNEERGHPCVMVCGNAVASVMRDRLDWCLRTTFCRGWPLADMAVIDRDVAESAYRLGGEVGVAGVVIQVLEGAKRVPRYWDRRVLLPMWDDIDNQEGA